MAYVYALKYLNSTIEDFLSGYDEDDCSIPYIEGKPYYAYIINSSMTDIDLAFISSDMTKVLELSEFGPESPEVAAFTGGNEEMTYDEREAYAEQLHQEGIDIICDEDGGLTYVGDALILDVPMSEIVKQIDLANDLGINPAFTDWSASDEDFIGNSDIASAMYYYICEKFQSNIYKDLYINEYDNRPIFVVKKTYWRF
jgi:hypothetical protein